MRAEARETEIQCQIEAALGRTRGIILFISGYVYSGSPGSGYDILFNMGRDLYNPNHY